MVEETVSLPKYEAFESYIGDNHVSLCEIQYCSGVSMAEWLG